MRKYLAFFLALSWPMIALLPVAPAAELSSPPKLSGGADVATVTIGGVKVDFLYFKEQTYKGRPWSNWGDGLAVDDKYYTAIML